MPVCTVGRSRDPDPLSLHLSSAMLIPLLLLSVPTPVLPLVASDQNGFDSAVVVMGDMNGDGVVDFVMGHRPDLPTYDAKTAGNFVWAMSGKDGAVIHTWDGGDYFGASLANVGDIDGDGVDDFATSEVMPKDAKRRVECVHLGAADSAAEHGFDVAPDPHAGNRHVRILSGRSGAEIASVGAAQNIKGFGVGLAGGHQLTGDSTPDLLIGATGFAWIVDGATFEPAFAFRMDSTGKIHRYVVEDWRLPALPEGKSNPTRPKIPNLLFTGDQGLDLGHSAAILPDMDGDGRGEVVLAGMRQKGQESVGQGGMHVSNVLWSSEQEPALAIASSGWCVLGGRDLDGDGRLDLVTSTVSHFVRAWSPSESRLLWSHASSTDGYNLGEGTSLAFVGDRDGDGVPEVLMGQNPNDDVAGGFLGGDFGHLFLLSGATGKVLEKRPVESLAKGTHVSGTNVGGMDVASLGDLDGDQLDEVVIQLAGVQEVHLLGGEDLSPLWSRSLGELPRICSAAAPVRSGK